MSIQKTKPSLTPAPCARPVLGVIFSLRGIARLMAGILPIMVLSVPLAVTAEEIIWGNRAVHHSMRNGDGAPNMGNENGVRYDRNSGAQGQQQGASQQNRLVAAVEKYLKGAQLEQILGPYLENLKAQLPQLNVNLPDRTQLNFPKLGRDSNQASHDDECYRADQVEKIDELFDNLNVFTQDQIDSAESNDDGNAERWQRYRENLETLSSEVDDAIYNAYEKDTGCDPQLAQLIQKLEGLFAAATQSESG